MHLCALHGDQTCVVQSASLLPSVAARLCHLIRARSRTVPAKWNLRDSVHNFLQFEFTSDLYS
jgi:hypothetical protein